MEAKPGCCTSLYHPGNPNQPQAKVKAHTLSRKHVRTLDWEVGGRPELIIWDVDAIYLVGPNSTTKIAATSAVPESSHPSPADKVLPIEVTVGGATPEFFSYPDGEPGRSYRVVARDEVILGIDLVRIAIRFPSRELCAPSSVDEAEDGLNLVDCGVLIHLPGGILPAVQLYPNDGFVAPISGFLRNAESIRAALPAQYEVAPVSHVPEHAQVTNEVKKG